MSIIVIISLPSQSAFLTIASAFLSLTAPILELEKISVIRISPALKNNFHNHLFIDSK
jgi:hypothetical protein